MPDFGITTTATSGSDLTWLASRHGTEAAQTATLSVTSLTAGTHYDANGVIHSGLAVGKITASGLYGPFDATATDGREKLAGFVLTDDVLQRDLSGAFPARTAFPLLVHGVIRPSRLPVAAQRTISSTTPTSGSFIYQ